MKKPNLLYSTRGEAKPTHILIPVAIFFGYRWLKPWTLAHWDGLVWWTHLTLGVVALVLAVGVIDALIRWVAGLRWFRRRAPAPTPTPEAARLTANAAATTAAAPAQQAAAPQPAPLPATPAPPRRWRTAEDLNIYDE